MIYRVLADITVIIHFVWILFLVFGSVAGVRYRSIKQLHLAGLAFAIIIQVFGWYCPLTYLEVWLREQYSPGGSYRGSFLIHYLEKVIYLELSALLLFLLTFLLIAVNIRIYRRKK